jgi:hypothetical protein
MRAAVTRGPAHLTTLRHPTQLMELAGLSVACSLAAEFGPDTHK